MEETWLEKRNVLERWNYIPRTWEGMSEWQIMWGLRVLVRLELLIWTFKPLKISFHTFDPNLNVTSLKDLWSNLKWYVHISGNQGRQWGIWLCWIENSHNFDHKCSLEGCWTGYETWNPKVTRRVSNVKRSKVMWACSSWLKVLKSWIF